MSSFFKTVIRSFAAAVGTYSRIPVPCFEWEGNEMKYAVCFFPFVGVIIGAAQVIWFLVCTKYFSGEMIWTFLSVLINILITGGIHLDGYMDTMDAIHSYGTRQKKLEILKDAHIGAFAVIAMAAYLLFYAGMISQIAPSSVLMYAGTFVLARILSGLSVVCFKNARGDGMLYAFSQTAQKRTVRAALVAELLLYCAVMVFLCGPGELVVCAASLGVFLYYRHRAYQEFGGITGDLAGWFLCLCELAGAAACVLQEFIFQ